jgi:hypothetical protein
MNQLCEEVWFLTNNPLRATDPIALSWSIQTLDLTEVGCTIFEGVSKCLRLRSCFCDNWRNRNDLISGSIGVSGILRVL